LLGSQPKFLIDGSEMNSRRRAKEAKETKWPLIGGLAIFEKQNMII
jgi:hypothetical protein